MQRATPDSQQVRPRAARGAERVRAAAARTSSRALAASCSSLYASTACLSSSFSYASWRSRRWRRAMSRISWSSVGVAERRAACPAVHMRVAAVLWGPGICTTCVLTLHEEAAGCASQRGAAMPWYMYCMYADTARGGCGLRQPAAAPPARASPPRSRPTLSARLTTKAVHPATTLQAPATEGPAGGRGPRLHAPVERGAQAVGWQAARGQLGAQLRHAHAADRHHAPADVHAAVLAHDVPVHMAQPRRRGRVRRQLRALPDRQPCAPRAPALKRADAAAELATPFHGRRPAACASGAGTQRHLPSGPRPLTLPAPLRTPHTSGETQPAAGAWRATVHPAARLATTAPRTARPQM